MCPCLHCVNTGILRVGNQMSQSKIKERGQIDTTPLVILKWESKKLNSGASVNITVHLYAPLLTTQSLTMTVTTHSLYTVSRKKGTNSILAVTLTNSSNFSQFLAQIILTFRWLKNCSKSHQYLHDTQWLCNDDAVVSSLKMPFSQEEREFRIHSASVVASKFVGFKSSWLQCVGHTARECVQKRRDWSRRPQAPHKNWVD